MQLTLHTFSAHWTRIGEPMDKFAQTLASALLLVVRRLAGWLRQQRKRPDHRRHAGPGTCRPHQQRGPAGAPDRRGLDFGARATVRLLFRSRPSSGPPTLPTRPSSRIAEQLAKAEKSYDSTFKVIRDRVSGDPDYCTDGRAPRSRPTAASSGRRFHAQAAASQEGRDVRHVRLRAREVTNEPFDAKKMYEDLERSRTSSFVGTTWLRSAALQLDVS